MCVKQEHITQHLFVTQLRRATTVMVEDTVRPQDLVQFQELVMKDISVPALQFTNTMMMPQQEALVVIVKQVTFVQLDPHLSKAVLQESIVQKTIYQQCQATVQRDISAQEEHPKRDQRIILLKEVIFVQPDIIVQQALLHQQHVQQVLISQIKVLLLRLTDYPVLQDITVALLLCQLQMDNVLQDFSVKEEILHQLQQRLYVLLAITVQLVVYNKFYVMRQTINLRLMKVLVQLVLQEIIVSKETLKQHAQQVTIVQETTK